MNATDHLAKARQARIAGDYAKAETLCREVLDKNPVHAEASAFLGQCLAELGDVGAARKHLELALSFDPENASIRLSSAILKEREGDGAGSIREALKASEIDPGKFEAWATLGNLLGKAHLFDKAAAALANACKLNPKHPGAALLLAGARLETGDLKGAEAALDLADAAAPGLVQSLTLRTHIARAFNDPVGIVRNAALWVQAAPSDSEARLALAHGWAAQGYFDEAAEACRPLAEAPSADAEHLAAMGRYRLGARDIDDALQWFDRALAADPRCAEAYSGRARALTYLGRLEEAEAACRGGLRSDPSHADCLAHLAEIRNGRLADEELASLRRLASERSLDVERKVTALFALGEVLHARKAHKEAFDAWRAANAIKAEQAAKSRGGGYSRNAHKAFVARLKKMYPGGDGAVAKTDGATPIFIVGMPRSGTSLLESALSAHPLVGGGGELPALPFILQQLVERPYRNRFAAPMPDHVRTEQRSAYFRNAEKFGLGNSLFFTDKQPSNFLAIGLIRQLFPEARIIHIRRDPLDTGFSIFRRNFSRQWPYAHDLSSIGHYYGQYADIMAHWEKNWPGAFESVQHERLVTNFEEEIRRLLRYCGLPWDDSCLNFHEAKRAVITFSAVQVRKPPSVEHLSVSAPYKELLEPLRAELIAAGVDLATGAKAETSAAGQTVH